MKLIKLFFMLVLIAVITRAWVKNSYASAKANAPETTYQMTEAEAKILTETKAYLEAGGKVDVVDYQNRT